MHINPPSIFLIGPRCCGKTTLSGLLAKRLGLPQLDTDALVCAEAGMSVAAIVEREGWEGFRARESQALTHAALAGSVTATGGGAVLSAENRALMRQAGMVLYLSAPAHILAERLERDGGALQRPSLTGEDPRLEMIRVLAEREALYRECAHHCLDASLSQEAVLEAATRLGKAFLRGTGAPLQNI